ncbi:MAPEG family protein [Halomonas maura]|uniref:MAPEG family protein n=1 Tax=Halomonas maura TaxID=117606 RepID=UPI0025B5DB3E|nr:MAPEG family protein [Halomonas maura]MDN3556525.1 MAPEG family protein [Halomonas maura]
MQLAYYYVGLSAALTVLLWVPYILARLVAWGLPAFLHNYPEGFPVKRQERPLWVERSQRAHLNMVETLPAFIGVVLAAAYLAGDDAAAVQQLALWSAVFFWARLAHAAVYTLGIPYLRTPAYLLSWLAILAIALQVVV